MFINNTNTLKIPFAVSMAYIVANLLDYQSQTLTAVMSVMATYALQQDPLDFAANKRVLWDRIKSSFIGIAITLAAVSLTQANSGALYFIVLLAITWLNTKFVFNRLVAIITAIFIINAVEVNTISYVEDRIAIIFITVFLCYFIDLFHITWVTKVEKA